MVILKDYIPSLLPNPILDQDSYKDVDGKGFLERFLGILGLELDTYNSSRLEEIVKLYEPLSILELTGVSSFDESFDISFQGLDINISKYLDYFAILLGDTPRFIDDDGDFARFLRYLIAIYKIKGTAKSYKALLTVLGHSDISITEIPNVDTIYDAVVPILYDTPGITYDQFCLTCSNYELNITTAIALDGLSYKKVRDLIYLLEPIGAHLSAVNWNATVVVDKLIPVTVDDNGALVYANPDDLGLGLDLVDGDYVISGPQLDRYYITDGLLYYILYV